MSNLFAGTAVAPTEVNGVLIWPGYLSRHAQEALLEDVRAIAKAAPPQAYATPGGRRMSVRMTAAGALGWMSDGTGYRYAATSPSGVAWPEIPERILEVWRTLSDCPRDPDSCLVTYYGEGARMGLHQDKDEAETRWPVLSISLGDDALFRIGQVESPSPSRSIWLRSGDVALMAGAARLVYHGIDRVKFGTSDLLSQGGRLNLTLRVAGKEPIAE